MKRIYIFIALILFTVQAFSQIGGLSGSKLASYCVDVVKPRTIEFEPSFSYLHSTRYWDDNGSLVSYSTDHDSVHASSGFGMRFTYGLFKNMEVGISVPTILDKGYFGIRYVLYQKDKLGVAAMAGFQLPLGDGAFSKKIHTEENTVQTGLGGVLSYAFNDNFSIDANLQYNRFLRKTVSGKTNNYTASLDGGYYFFDHTFQLIASFYYEYNKLGDRFQDVLMVFPGFTVETGKSFIIVASVPFSVYGHNTQQGVGFSFALTLTFD